MPTSAPGTRGVRRFNTRITASVEPPSSSVAAAAATDAGARADVLDRLEAHDVVERVVVEGEVLFQLGNEKRVIGPEDGEMIVRPGTKHGLTSSSTPS